MDSKPEIKKIKTVGDWGDKVEKWYSIFSDDIISAIREELEKRIVEKLEKEIDETGDKGNS